MHAPVERYDKIQFAAFFIAKDREAVIDGFLVDHEPPIQIRTELSAAGIVWEKGASVQIYVSTSHFYVRLDAEGTVRCCFDIEQQSSPHCTPPGSGYSLSIA
jgi:hypothetical protein